MKVQRGFQIRALGEIAIRCQDVAAMVAFYEDIIGLERMAGDAGSRVVFFRIADGFGGHTSVLALFDKEFEARVGLHPTSETPPVTGGGSSLHHIALSVAFEEQEAAIAWFTAQGLAPRVEIFGWVGWRGVFVTDPEGNTVELVAYSDRLLDGSGGD